MPSKWQRDEAANALLEKLEQATAESILRLPTDAADDAKRLKRVEETRVGAFEQPEAITRTLDALRAPAEELAARLKTHPLRRIYLTGAGDSWFVAVGARLVFERLLGVPCEAIQALEYAHYYHGPTDETCVVIAISSSGNTPRALEAIYRAKEAGAFTIGVTTSKPSALTTETDGHLHAQASRKGWPTQTSTASLAGLVLFAVLLAQWRNSSTVSERGTVLDALAKLPEQVQHALERTDARMAELGEELRNAPIHLFAGAGPALAAASFGAAKVKELCPVHAIAMPLEEYHHYRAQKPDDPLFLVAPQGLSVRRALDTVLESQRVGGRTIALVTEGDRTLADKGSELIELPAVYDGLVAIPYAAPLHLYSYHLAMAKYRHHEGYPPGLQSPHESSIGDGRESSNR